MEFLNRAYNKLHHIVLSLFFFKSNLINLFFARIKGIKYGSNIKTKGKLYFFRTPLSKISIGSNCEFRSSKNSNLIGINKYCIISTHSSEAQLVIGNNCGFSGVTIGCRERISIGSDCMVGANVIITDTDWHSLNPMERKSGIPKTKPTIIHNNVFIGVNAIILKGSEIGENSVIGAGSIVSGKIPPNVIAAGNPCKVVRPLNIN